MVSVRVTLTSFRPLSPRSPRTLLGYSYKDIIITYMSPAARAQSQVLNMSFRVIEEHNLRQGEATEDEVKQCVLGN